MSVLYQDAFGNFSDEVMYQINFDGNNRGGTAEAITHGDINNDGEEELLIAFRKDDWFYSVSLADTGVYAAKHLTETSVFPHHSVIGRLAVADVDNDGLNDVVSFLQLADRLAIYRQHAPTNLLRYPYYYSTSQGGFAQNDAMALGDLDGDGLIDLALVNSTDYKLIICPQKDGMFSNENDVIYKTGSYPRMVEVADLNCDGSNDILVFENYFDTLKVWETNENGSYEKTVSVKIKFGNFPEVNQVAIGDLNGDGLKDVLIVADRISTKGFCDIYYNTSTPSVFDTLETSTITIDTLYSEIVREEVLLDTTYQEVRDGNLNAVTDSFYVATVIQKDSISIDSMYIRTANLCGSVYRDTIQNDTVYFKQIILSRDTVLLSTNRTCLDCVDTSAKCPMYLPNAFTPDGDGINDVFMPVSECVYYSYRFTIYDRWAGNPIFETNLPNEGWDGKHSKHGLNCPVDVYPYTIFYSVGGVELLKSGTVSLLR